MTSEALRATLSPETVPGSDSTSEPDTALHDASQPRESAPLPHSCKCGARWSGGNTCHCGAQRCHLTFSSPSSFTAHRRDGQCADPATVGLVERQRNGYTVWGAPSDDRSPAHWSTDDTQPKEA